MFLLRLLPMLNHATKTHEAWIDVGGTFTDCYLRRPDGTVTRTKLLSSGVVPISLESGNDGGASGHFEATELRGDAAGFWVGAWLRFYDQAGSIVDQARVTGFVNGSLHLERPLAGGVGRRSGELDAGIEAPVLATRRLLGIPLGEPLPRLRVRMGTTKGTNALLTRRGARTALAITAPLEDLLWIGDQTRPDLFALAIKRPQPLAELTLGIHERLNARGEVLLPLDEDRARHDLHRARQAGCESLAICLMHSYANSQHELQLVRLAQAVGFTQISRSSELAPLIEIVPRAQTAVVDAYLSPIVRDYLERLVTQFGGEESTQLLVMTSAGGLVRWRDYYGKDSILSGPAGGVSALRHLAQVYQQLSGAARLPELIGLDMGGTSTDVCRVSGDHNLQYESTKAGVRIFTPTLPIETVASGGGSICWFDGVSLRVGPQSAGATPGPACYGRGGPLTVTDLNVFLGRIPGAQFPFPIDREAISRRLSTALVESQTALGFTSEVELAQGFRRIVNEQMAAAVRTVSIAQGVDPRGQCLVGFGGAAGQHICEIAESLGIERVIDSAEAGLLSALGMGLAPLRLDAVVSVYKPLIAVDWIELSENARQVEQRLIDELHDQGIARTDLQVTRWLELRYAKTEATLTIAWPELPATSEQLATEFAAAHHKRYGYARAQSTLLELVAARMEVTSQTRLGVTSLALDTHGGTGSTRLDLPSDTNVATDAKQDANQSSRWKHYRRHELAIDQTVHGPAIVLNVGSTLVIDVGWRGTWLRDGLLVLEKHESPTEAEPTSPRHAFDPIFRDCFAQRLAAIAAQMGIVLQHTAVSVNVKQRRDYSCAVFDQQGQLLANAPHVPVHLGAMGQTVREILVEFPHPRPGDSFITNDPYRGGSHLPDVTVVTPVFDDAEPARLKFFVANRAHHADIGGVAPGSMSVSATRLGDEGVIIAPRRLTAAGDDCATELRRLLSMAPHPPRNIDENLADIAAQLAANARGVELIMEYAATNNWEQLQHYSTHVLDSAEQRVRNFLMAHPITPGQFADFLDDGTKIQVSIALKGSGGISIDFSGSGPTSLKNFNANRSIVTAAVIYVLRCLIADELPLNEGVMRCVELTLPTGVLNPKACDPIIDSPAVAAGNVETSQRLVDVLLGALGVAAASQGTMNNLLFGNQRFGFYETICGGAGGTHGQVGASGVHTHMTNTRLTDPEVLEARYPVRLQHFGLRAGSGGHGRWRGGDGVKRVLLFLEPVELSLLTSRRGPYAPFGLDGGQAGSLGYNTLVRIDGTRLSLAGCCQVAVASGEQLEILTPGGGGFGRALQDDGSGG